MPTQIKAKDAPDLNRFDWADPFLLAAQLTEDERMFSDAAEEFIVCIKCNDNCSMFALI